MKILKIVIGIVIFFASTKVMIEMAQEESGPYLYGAITAFVIITSISIFLIYSGTRPDLKKNSTTFEVKSIEDNLEDLKNKGIITVDEYSEKITKINLEKDKNAIQSSIEYRQLKNLFDSEILSKEEFENKVALLKSPAEIIYKTVSESDLLGCFLVNGVTYSYLQNNIFTMQNEGQKGKPTVGKWYLIKGNIIEIEFASNKASFKNIEFDSNGFHYINGKTKFYARRRLR
jgi:uncharacterized protein YqgQ